MLLLSLVYHQISGDSQTAGSAAADWSCPEVHLEHFRRGRGWRSLGRGLGRGVVQPAVTTPQLTFITERDEGRSSWAPTSGNTKGGNAFDNAETRKGDNAAGEDDLDTGVAASEISDRAVDESGGSKHSSLQPNDGSSVRTSISSYISSNSNSKSLRKLGRAKSEERAKPTHDADQPPLAESCRSKPPAASASSIPTNGSLTDQNAPPSWRERVQKQQKTFTSCSDGAGDNMSSTTSRWAAARRQEEISSIAHARRIKHLIEQSRQRGGASGVSPGRSAVEEIRHGPGQDQSFLRVEGQQRAQSKLSLTPSATATSGTANKVANSEGMEGMWLNMLPSPHPVLPPVRKNQDVDGGVTGDKGNKQRKHQPIEKSVLGDLLDAQSFFSHGISLGSTDTTSKKPNLHHYNHHHPTLQQHFIPQDKHPSTKASLPRTLGPTGTANRITLATAAVIGEQPQPRLKYTAAFQHKLTGGCLP